MHQSHNATRTALNQSHNTTRTAHDQGATPGDEEATVLLIAEAGHEEEGQSSLRSLHAWRAPFADSTFSKMATSELRNSVIDLGSVNKRNRDPVFLQSG